MVGLVKRTTYLRQWRPNGKSTIDVGLPLISRILPVVFGTLALPISAAESYTGIDLYTIPIPNGFSSIAVSSGLAHGPLGALSWFRCVESVKNQINPRADRCALECETDARRLESNRNIIDSLFGQRPRFGDEASCELAGRCLRRVEPQWNDPIWTTADPQAAQIAAAPPAIAVVGDSRADQRFGGGAKQPATPPRQSLCGAGVWLE
jgi:hypothetical protein